MATLTAHTQLPKSRTTKSLGYDFALLGLQGREARVDVIRNAAEQVALKIPDTLKAAERVDILSELAASTYRLLDPRRRLRTLERVQLCLVSENEPAMVTVGQNPLVPASVTEVSDQADALVRAEIVQSTAATVELASKVSHDNVSRAGEEKLPRKSSHNARVGLVGISLLATLVTSIALVAWLLLYR